MKLRNVILLSAAGMLLTGAAVLTLAPPRREAAAEAEAPAPEDTAGRAVAEAPPAGEARERFEAEGTLRIEGRVGHARLSQGGSGRTYVLLEVRAAAGERAADAAPNHLAIVLDRSGSMKGERLPNAIAGAIAALDRLRDGDFASVIAFDDRASVLVPATRLDLGSRSRVAAAIRGITLGGDTCISCALDSGMTELEQTRDAVDRMVVLSDGDATAGVRDIPGFRRISRRAGDQGVCVTTIGVGLAYNQKILGIIAQESGGGHYFVEDAATIDRAMQGEAAAVQATVAMGATATITLAEGVELARVHDRAFERRDRAVVVPLGSLGRGETRTVLAEVLVPTRAAGLAPVAAVELGYRDLVRREPARLEGRLAVEITQDAAGAAALDPLVSGRLARSGTAAALLSANELVAQGRPEEARRVLDEQGRALDAAAAEARRAVSGASGDRRAEVEADFEAQARALREARSGLDQKAPAPVTQRAVRARQAAANPFML